MKTNTPKKEQPIEIYMDWLDEHPPIAGHHISWKAGSLQCEFNKELSIGRATEIVKEWQEANQN